MEVKVRNVSPKFISEIDKRCLELTEKTGNKWSRNDYLKLVIENDFERPLANYKQDRFDELIQKFAEVQAHNTKVLEEYIDTTNQLIERLITPI